VQPAPPASESSRASEMSAPSDGLELRLHVPAGAGSAAPSARTNSNGGGFISPVSNARVLPEVTPHDAPQEAGLEAAGLDAGAGGGDATAAAAAAGDEAAGDEAAGDEPTLEPTSEPTLEPTLEPSAGPPLPAHLAARVSVAEQRALRERMRRELMVDEARNAEPRRRIGRNARVLYTASLGTLSFLALFLLRVEHGPDPEEGGGAWERAMPWRVVLLPLVLQYLGLLYHSTLDVADSYQHFALQRTSGVPALVLIATKQLAARAHESLWHLVCASTCAALACHLDGLGPGIVQTFTPVWVYGVVSVVAGSAFFAHGLASHCAHETSTQLLAGLQGFGYALAVRVLPVALVVAKLQGGLRASWTVVFIPLWVSIGCLALMGLCVLALVPVLVVTQERAGRILGSVVTLAALLMLIPALCSLAFLILLVHHLDGQTSQSQEPPSLTQVVTPILVMYVLLALLTPVLVRTVHSTHNVLDAMHNQPQPEPSPGSPGGRFSGRPGQRPGVEVPLAGRQPRLVFVRQTSTFFKQILDLDSLEEKLRVEKLQGERVPSDSTSDSPVKDTASGDPASDDLESGEAPTSAPASAPAAAPASAPASAEGRAESQCYVCCEKSRNAVLQPCGHGGMCYECAVEFASAPAYQRVLGATEAGALPKCPLCRQFVSEVLRLDPQGLGSTFVASTSWRILSTAVGASGAHPAAFPAPIVSTDPAADPAAAEGWEGADVESGELAAPAPAPQPVPEPVPELVPRRSFFSWRTPDDPPSVGPSGGVPAHDPEAGAGAGAGVGAGAGAGAADPAPPETATHAMAPTDLAGQAVGAGSEGSEGEGSEPEGLSGQI